MTTLYDALASIFAICLTFLALAVLFDFNINEGDGLRNIIKSNHYDPLDTNEILNQLTDELDDLYDELAYEDDESIKATIKAKIALRENRINSLLNK